MIDSRTPSRCCGLFPAALSALFGREADLDVALRQLEANARLLSVTGAAGIGKTRFVAELAARWSRAWPDQRVCYCALDDCRSAADIERALARALTDSDRIDAIERALHERATLLVLDSPEPVLNAASQLVARLLAACPTTTIVCSSRERPSIVGEVVHELDALDTTADGPALQMLVDRVQRLRAINDGEREALQRIVRRVEGVPLLIEFAAARLRSLSAEEFATRLERDVGELRAQLRALAPRHATIDACVRWSYDLLSARQQQALEACSVFRGSFSLRAAESVIGGADALDTLLALCDASMVRTIESAERGDRRFALYSVIARFAAQRAEDNGTSRAAQRRMIEHYGAADEARALQWLATPQDRLENDGNRAQLLAVVDYTLALREPPLAQHGLRARLCVSFDSAQREEIEQARCTIEALMGLAALVPAAPQSASLRQYASVACAFAASALGEIDASEAALDALTLDALTLDALTPEIHGFIAYIRALNAFKAGRATTVVARLDEAISHFSQLRDDARCTAFEATVAQTLATLDDPQWEQRSARAEQRAESLLDERLRIMVLSKRAVSLFEHGRLERAEATAHRVLQLSEDHHVDDRKWMAIGTLGEIAHERGDFALALRRYNDTLRAVRNANARDIALIHAYRGAALLALGEAPQAAATLEAQVHALDQCGDRAHALVFRAWLALAWTQCERGDQARTMLRSLVDDARPTTPNAPWLCAWLARASVEDEPRESLFARVDRFAPVAASDAQREELEVIAAHNADVRLVRDWLRRWLSSGPTLLQRVEALTIAADGSWFEQPHGERVSLAGRSTLRAILATLATAAHESAGRALGARALIDAAWPEDKIAASSAQNRLQVALSTLRRMGLRSWLVHRPEGYMLDPSRPVRIVETARAQNNQSAKKLP